MPRPFGGFLWNWLNGWLNPSPSPRPPSPAPTPAPPSPAPVPPSPSSAGAQEALAAHNTARAQYQIGALAFHPALVKSSQTYAETLAKWGQLSHVGPDGSTFDQRIVLAGYGRFKTAGENIAAAPASYSGDQITRLWLGDAGHRANVLGPLYTHVGFGIAQDMKGNVYWVADYAAPLSVGVFSLERHVRQVIVRLPPPHDYRED